MKIVSLLFLLGLCVTLYTIPYGQSALSVIEENSTEIGTIPCVHWIFNIDAADGYVAVITDEGKTFQLFGSTAESGFSVSLEDNGAFFTVSMRSRSGLVRVGKAFSEGHYQYIGYDYNGRAVLGPVETENVVEIDPTGRFFYSVYDIGNDHNKPAIYDSDGSTMAEFKSSDIWDIKVLDSSRILFCDHNRIQIFRYPDFTVEKEIIVPYDRTVVIPCSAFSPDGTFYAYVVHDKIFISDLNTGQIFHVPNRMRNNSPTYPKLALSPNGTYLVITQPVERKQAIAVYKRQDGGYVQVTERFSVPIPPGYGSFYNTAIGDSYCVCSYFSNTDNGIEYMSYLFALPSTVSTTLVGKTIDGLGTIDASAQSGQTSFRATAIKSNFATTGLIKIQGAQK